MEALSLDREGHSGLKHQIPGRKDAWHRYGGDGNGLVYFGTVLPVTATLLKVLQDKTSVKPFRFDCQISAKNFAYQSWEGFVSGEEIWRAITEQLSKGNDPAQRTVLSFNVLRELNPDPELRQII